MDDARVNEKTLQECVMLDNLRHLLLHHLEAPELLHEGLLDEGAEDFEDRLAEFLVL